MKRESSTDFINSEFGVALRKVREVRGYTQQALADLAGLKRLSISQVECGHRGLSTSAMHTVAHVLDYPIPLFYVLGKVILDRKDYSPEVFKQLKELALFCLRQQ